MRTRLILAFVASFVLASAAQAQHSYGHYHLDVAGRQAGLRAFEQKDYTAAREAFEDAALHADKGSQAMLAELYWGGLGVERDAALAYVWADLAAERGYPLLVAKREHYWKALNADERRRALDIGVGYYEEYGDAVAQPRLEILLRRGHRQATGSRVGAFAGTQVYRDVWKSNEEHGLRGLKGAKAENYYMPQQWVAKDYWRTQDRVWTNAQPPTGHVEVLPVEVAGETGVPPSMR